MAQAARTNEPPIKTAVNSVAGIVAAARRDGIEWVFLDTPPNMSAVVEDAIRNATMAIIPARPGVFDVNAVQETIQSCRAARKPYAVVLNGAPARRDDVESPILPSRVNRWPSSGRRCGRARSPTAPIS